MSHVVGVVLWALNKYGMVQLVGSQLLLMWIDLVNESIVDGNN